MSSPSLPLDDVFTTAEVARAAGASVRAVESLVASGRLATIDGRFITATDAVQAVRALSSALGDTGAGSPISAAAGHRGLFEAPPASHRSSGLPFAASGALHAGLVALLALVTSLGVRGATNTQPAQQMRMVFLSLPGPGGGGGGGGLRQPKPPARAKLEGKSALKSPVPVSRMVKAPKPEPRRESPPPPPPLEAAPKRVEPPPPVAAPDPIPPVVAPVVSAAADERTAPGILAEATGEASRGPGTGGGSGTGSGTGIGEGDGRGIGPGSGGGTGGGPYGPGSGVTAPTLRHEVKPLYSEEARQRHIEGEVVLEIVVRADGRVGNVRLVQGLGAGLDRLAAEAVRQWRFDPARRLGAPVDVLVEVAVEFRLR
jgi:TonB family protein